MQELFCFKKQAIYKGKPYFLKAAGTLNMLKCSLTAKHMKSAFLAKENASVKRKQDKILILKTQKTENKDTENTGASSKLPSK